MLPAQLNSYEIKNLRPSMRYSGGDFFEWQKEARKTLCRLLGMDKFETCELNFKTEYEREKDGYTETRFTFDTEPGYTSLCVMLKPKAASKGFMICLQGHSTGMHNSLGIKLDEPDARDPRDGDRDFAIQAVKRGYTAMALEQRCFGERGGTPRPDCQHSSLMAIMRGRTTIGERVWDVLRLTELIDDRFNPEKLPIYVMGNSGGGTASLYCAAVIERISGAVPSCAVCTWKESIAYVKHCTCNYIPGIANYFDMGDIAGLIAPRVYVQVNGRDDDIFLLSGAKECFDIAKGLYAAAGAKEKCAFVIGEGGHRFYAEPAWKIFEEINGQPG
ncbi:MAG: hypothetical protein IJS90_06810 [Clostridia bacterium]|nr:hypothetical protein [Clostridia bacterium]